MDKVFLESHNFTEWILENLDDVTYLRFQLHLMKHPDSGAVMPECGGLRKVRLALPRYGRGKRGGARVVYLHVPEADRIYFLDAYSKNEKADVDAAQKKKFKRLAEQLIQEARHAMARMRKGKRS
jgi:hypothetical protein